MRWTPAIRLGGTCRALSAKHDHDHDHVHNEPDPADSHDDFKPKRKPSKPTNEQEAHSIIKQDVTNNKVFLYMKGTPQMPQCGFSRQVVLILNKLGVDFKSRNVLEDDQIRSGIKSYSNWPTVPQLYVDGELVGGCDLVTEEFQKGELQTRLAKASATMKTKPK